jgi:hypothetical protein
VILRLLGFGHRLNCLICQSGTIDSSDLTYGLGKMLTTVDGVYRDGRIELSNLPSNVAEDTKVIVTFVGADTVDLAAHGIDRVQAATLRNSLDTFADDWNSPEMSIYDNYDVAKSQL